MSLTESEDDSSDEELPPPPDSSEIFRKQLEQALRNNPEAYRSTFGDFGAGGNETDEPKSLFEKMIQKSFPKRKESYETYISNPENVCPLSLPQLSSLIKKEKHPVIMSLTLKIVLHFLETKTFRTDFLQLLPTIFGSFNSLRTDEGLIPIFFFFIEHMNPPSVIQKTVSIYEKEKNVKLKQYLIQFWSRVMTEYGLRVFSNTTMSVVGICRKEYKVMKLRTELKSFILQLHRFSSLQFGKKLESQFPELKSEFENQASRPTERGRREGLSLTITKVKKMKKKKRKKKKPTLRKKNLSRSKVGGFSSKTSFSSNLPNKTTEKPPPVVRIGMIKAAPEGNDPIEKKEIPNIPSIPPPPPISEKKEVLVQNSFGIESPQMNDKPFSVAVLEEKLKNSKNWKEKVEILQNLEKSTLLFSEEEDEFTRQRLQTLLIREIEIGKNVPPQIASLRCLSNLKWIRNTDDLVKLLNKFGGKNNRVAESLKSTLEKLKLKISSRLFTILVAPGKVNWKNSDVLVNFLEFLRPFITKDCKLAYEVLKFFRRENVLGHSQSRVRTLSSEISNEISSVHPPPPPPSARKKSISRQSLGGRPNEGRASSLASLSGPGLRLSQGLSEKRPTRKIKLDQTPRERKLLGSSRKRTIPTIIESEKPGKRIDFPSPEKENDSDKEEKERKSDPQFRARTSSVSFDEEVEVITFEKIIDDSPKLTVPPPPSLSSLSSPKEENKNFDSRRTFSGLLLEKKRILEDSSSPMNLQKYFDFDGKASRDIILYREISFLMNQEDYIRLYRTCLRKMSSLNESTKERELLNSILGKIVEQSNPTWSILSFLSLLEEFRADSEKSLKKVNNEIPPSDKEYVKILTGCVVKIIRELRNNKDLVDIASLLDKVNEILNFEIGYEKRGSSLKKKFCESNLWILRIIKTIITQLVKVFGNDIFKYTRSVMDKTNGIMKCIICVFGELGVPLVVLEGEEETDRLLRRSVNTLVENEELQKRLYERHREYYDDEENEEDCGLEEEKFETLKKKFDEVYSRTMGEE